MINLIPYPIILNPIYDCTGPEKSRGNVWPMVDNRWLGAWGHRRTFLSFFRTGPHII
jgi:hypothetical protein